MSTIAIVGSAAIIAICLLVTNDAYAHTVRGGFYDRQPDYFLMLVMIGAASFGILAVIVKRIGMVLSLGLLGGSLLVLVISWFVLMTLGWQEKPIGSASAFYYEILPYVVGVSLVGSVGGLVLIGYHFFAVRPYMKYKSTK